MMRAAIASDCSHHLWWTLHLLDLSRVGENYVSMLVKQYGGADISTHRRNLTLPPEIWYMIVELLRDDDGDESGGRRKGNYCFVRASPLSTSNSNNGDENHNTDGNERSSDTSSQPQTNTIVRCTRYNFNEETAESGTVAGHLSSAHAVGIFEDFLVSPDVFDKSDPEAASNYGYDREEQEIIPELLPTEEAFDVMLPLAPSQQDDAETKKKHIVIPCLYTQIDVQDVIAFIDKGNCLVCDGGSREICPGCGRLPDAFGVFGSCGNTITCPLCIGQDLASEHLELNRMLDDDGRWGPSEEQENEEEENAEDENAEEEWIRKRIRERKNYLGYL